MSNSLLEVSNFSLSVGNKGRTVSILKNVFLEVKAGESVCILGSSASGKSMLALSIMGLIPEYKDFRSQGEIFFYNEEGIKTDLTTLSKSQWRKLRASKIAMIFQDAATSFNPVRSCGSQIVEVLMAHQKIKPGRAKSMVYNLMDRLGIEQKEAVYRAFPHQLSGGQLQRMMIAMAMIGQPELLIADEATSNLDEKNKAEIVDLLWSMQKDSGCALIYITHDQAEAEKIAGRQLFMSNGQLLELEKGKNDADSVTDNTPFMKSVEYRATLQATNSQSSPLFTVSSLTKSYKRRNFFGKVYARVQVLDDVNMQINRGESIGLMGVSGSGKSTLGRLILCLEQADKGSVLFKGEELSCMSTSQLRTYRKHFQIVYQNPYNTLNPRMNVLSIVREPLEVHHFCNSLKERNERARNLLLNCGIPEEKQQQFTFQLSGGQRQRVAIARAMILEPEFVVLDECVSSLDDRNRENIIELLHDFKVNQQISYLFIGHDKKLVERFSDRVFCLERGNLIQV